MVHCVNNAFQVNFACHEDDNNLVGELTISKKVRNAIIKIYIYTYQKLK